MTSSEFSSFDSSDAEYYDLQDCPHCGKEIDLGTADTDDDGRAICPHCGQTVPD